MQKLFVSTRLSAKNKKLNWTSCSVYGKLIVVKKQRKCTAVALMKKVNRKDYLGLLCQIWNWLLGCVICVKMLKFHDFSYNSHCLASVHYLITKIWKKNDFRVWFYLYSMIYYIAIFAKSIILKKSMKELSYSPDFCPWLPKKIWALRTPTH